MTDLQRIISTTLRAGVTLACVIALCGVGGYLLQQGGVPVKDFSTFTPPAPEHTDLVALLSSAFSGEALSWVQMGVLCLILTPILRVLLSFADFCKEGNGLYALISILVLVIILLNSIAGIK